MYPFLRGTCRQGWNSIWYCVKEMPQKDPLDDVAYTCMLSYPFVSLLSFNFLRLLLLFSIYLGGVLKIPGKPARPACWDWACSSGSAPRKARQQSCCALSGTGCAWRSGWPVAGQQVKKTLLLPTRRKVGRIILKGTNSSVSGRTNLP